VSTTTAIKTTLPPLGMAAWLSLAAAFLVPAAMPVVYLPFSWLGSLAALVLFCACIGRGIAGRSEGILIDYRNRISLSKFQAAAWTVLVLSALITAVFGRLHMGIAQPVDVTVPQQLLAVMGISLTSLAAAPVILGVKQEQTPGPGNAPVFTRDDPQNAEWLDMLRGEENSNYQSADLGKVQQLLITLIVLVIYGAGLWALFANPAGGGGQLSALPDLSDQMVWLVGISHAGYLAYKAAPHGDVGVQGS